MPPVHHVCLSFSHVSCDASRIACMHASCNKSHTWESMTAASQLGSQLSAPASQLLAPRRVHLELEMHGGHEHGLGLGLGLHVMVVAVVRVVLLLRASPVRPSALES